MQHQEVQVVCSTALEFLRNRHANKVGEAFRPAQLGVGEAGVALGTEALAFIKIVSDHSHQAVGGTIDPGEGASEQLVGLAVSIHIGGDECSYPGLVGGFDALDKALLAERLAEVHEPPPAPCSVGCGCRIHSVSKNGFPSPPQSGAVFFMPILVSEW